jgi:energy-coupling factor transporter ATP-binding protein EcfA2
LNRAESTVVNFDVFLSHNSLDKASVEEIARKLKDAGLEPWLDKWCLTPGDTFQPGLADGLRNCATCAIFIGSKGLGNWAREELLVAQDRAAREAGYRLIPILLPGVSDPFDFSKLPPFLTQRTWVDFRGGLDQERPFRILVNAIKGKPPGPDAVQSRADDTCPYQGLEVFDEVNAEFFFGRERDVQRLVEKLKATRFLAVLGASGSGKSSLVRAGLIPALREGALPQSEGWTMCVFKPGSRPLTTLTAQLLHICPGKDSMQNTLDQMANDERTFHLAVTLALANKPAMRIVWIVDQFEEIFTLCNDEKERASFLRNLLYASSIPDGQSTVLLTMRADFLPKCGASPDLAARVAAQQFLVSPMDADMLRQAIEEPARRVRLGFEPGLVDIILGDIASEPGALPLLEHALLELWKRRRDHTLTLDGYRESGGVKGAIAKTAEEIFKTFNAVEQAIVRRIMLRLTQLGEGTEDTRRRATVDEVITTSSEADAVEHVIKAMADARLLTTT